MPRIRTIKPEFFSDEKMAPLPVLTRFVFLGLISMADDCGRVLDNVKIIDAYIFPETSETSRGSLAELSAMGRLQRGVTASGQRIIQIVNWSAHQKIEKPNLRGALPPIDPQAVAVSNVEDHSPTVPRRVREASGKDRGGVGEESQNHTNDLGPTTNDRGPSTVDRARGADTTTTATADPFADALSLVPCETSAQQQAVRDFFAALPAGQRPGKWGAWLGCLLEGMGMPGGQAATLNDLVVGLTEFLSDETRDFKQRFVLAFIADAKRRREQSGSAPTAANGSPNASGVVEYSTDLFRRRAEFFEWLCNERTWNQSTPAYRQNDVQWLKRQGYVPDEAQFRAEWEILQPLADADLYRDRSRGEVITLFADALATKLAPAGVAS